MDSSTETETKYPVLFYHESGHLFSIVYASNVVGDSEAFIAGRFSVRYDS